MLVQERGKKGAWKKRRKEEKKDGVKGINKAWKETMNEGRKEAGKRGRKQRKRGSGAGRRQGRKIDCEGGRQTSRQEDRQVTNQPYIQPTRLLGMQVGNSQVDTTHKSTPRQPDNKTHRCKWESSQADSGIHVSILAFSSVSVIVLNIPCEISSIQIFLSSFKRFCEDNEMV